MVDGEARDARERRQAPRAGSMAMRTGGRTQTSALLGQLRRDILTGVLTPDQPLRMPALRQRYDAGLTPLREALFQLAAEGLVTVEDQRGFKVASMSSEDLADLTAQRVLLESEALRLAIVNGGLNWEARVLAAHHRLAGTVWLVDGRPPASEAWAEAHRDFHTVLLEACGSPWLLRLRGLLYDQSERYRQWSTQMEPGRDVAGEHRALCEAVLARDADRAVRCLTDHYWRTAHLCDFSALPSR